MASTLTITELTLLDGGQAHPGSTVAMRDGRFTHAGVGPAPDGNGGADAVMVDGSGWLAAPGYIDLQLNGAYGHDFTREPASISKVAARLPQSGVTAFLPTFITSPLEAYAPLLNAVHGLMAADKAALPPGARVLGAHVEGPFLSPHRPGAHNPALIRPPTPVALALLQPLEAIAMLTLAPEEPGGLDAVRWLVEHGVVASMGHSMATVEQAREGAVAGVTCATHLFNAMAPLHHRQPGLAGFALGEARVRCGLIADGIHVHPLLVALAFRARGAGALALVTDAMAGMGMAPGDYEIGDRQVSVDETSARLADGTLAGSILRMDEAVRNMVDFCGCSPAEAVQMASTTPAAVLGIDGQMGRVQTGYAADLVLLDQALHVQATFVGGRALFVNPAARERLGPALTTASTGGRN